jgi:dGTPase
VNKKLANDGKLREDPDKREWGGSKERTRSYRTPAQRDRDRILYSSAFHRLAYVTQVTAPEAGHNFHNRLGHSLKVAQVGRRNAERLKVLAAAGELDDPAATLVNSLDPDAIEAACLAHDLGHPPFGHIAEKALHEEAQEQLGAEGDRGKTEFDAFEGNAQSFRIVTRLAIRDEHPGLNLTRQTLDGLLKYPWGYSTDPKSKAHFKWGFYASGSGSEASDEAAFRFVRPDAEDPTSVGEPRCLEAEIMDWADDVTYAVHDLDDFFRAGLIPLHRLWYKKSPECEALRKLLTEAKAAEEASFPKYSVDELLAAVHEALSVEGPETAYHHTADNRAQMREFGSKLITKYLNAFEPVAGEGSSVELRIEPDARCEVEALKMLVRVFVIRRPGLAVVQHGQERVIRCLFRRYFEASEGGKGDGRIFPPGAKERLLNSRRSPEQRARVVIDLIAGLTEAGAVKLHQRLEGGWTSVRALDATADQG